MLNEKSKKNGYRNSELFLYPFLKDFVKKLKLI